MCDAFGLSYLEARTELDLNSKVQMLIKSQGPALLEVYIKENQEIYPRTGFSEGEDGIFKALPLRSMDPAVELPNMVDVAP